MDEPSFPNAPDAQKAFDKAVNNPPIENALEQEMKEVDFTTPEHEFRPPVQVSVPEPGGPGFGSMDKISKEELDISTRGAIEESQNRFSEGRTEMDAHLPSIDEVEGAGAEYMEYSRGDGKDMEQEPCDQFPDLSLADRFNERAELDFER